MNDTEPIRFEVRLFRGNELLMAAGSLESPTVWIAQTAEMEIPASNGRKLVGWTLEPHFDLPTGVTVHWNPDEWKPGDEDDETRAD